MLHYLKDRVSGYVQGKIERQKQAVQARRDAVEAERDRQRRETEHYQSARFFPRESGYHYRPQNTRDPRYAERVAQQQHYYRPITKEELYRFRASREVRKKHMFYRSADGAHHRYPPPPPATYPPVHPWGSTPYYQQYVDPYRDMYRPSPAELMRAGGYTPSILDKQGRRSRRHY